MTEPPPVEEILKCEPSECCVNNYNGSDMLTCQHAYQLGPTVGTVSTKYLCLCHVCSLTKQIELWVKY